MTWSIIARDEPTGRIGIAVATKFFAVGALVPHIRTGAGAIASQAFINPFYGPKGLAMLASGSSAKATVESLINDDDGRANRQIHVMDAKGTIAEYTGSACIGWHGHASVANCSVAGNMLADGTVIAKTLSTYESSHAMPFARRLLAAMHAGEAAGGDKRGRQSAALLIHDGEDYPLLDLRVDDHADPLAELARLEVVARERFVHFRRHMPNRAQPSGLIDRSGIDDLITQSIKDGFE